LLLNGFASTQYDDADISIFLDRADAGFRARLIGLTLRLFVKVASMEDLIVESQISRL
jgi:hypothetical protein